MFVSPLKKEDKRSMDVRMVHFMFRLSLVVKGLFAFGETLAGFLLIYFTPSRVLELVHYILSTEIGREYIHFWKEYLLDFGHSYTVGTQLFAIFYLISHGAVKFVIIVLLWQERLWAYPLSVASLLGFIVYQLYRYQMTHSIMLILLTIFDIILIILTFIEFYNLLKGRQPMHAKRRRARLKASRLRKRQARRADIAKVCGKWSRRWCSHYNRLKTWCKRCKRRLPW